nr:unnamed protein product [Digitaria exilis]
MSTAQDSRSTSSGEAWSATQAAQAYDLRRQSSRWKGSNDEPPDIRSTKTPGCPEVAGEENTGDHRYCDAHQRG